jgi:hypothetical protein
MPLYKVGFLAFESESRLKLSDSSSCDLTTRTTEQVHVAVIL